jgi:hypothetical protein
METEGMSRTQEGLQEILPASLKDHLPTDRLPEDFSENLSKNFEVLLQKGKYRARDLASQTRNFVQDKPYMALAATIVGGTVLGLILGRFIKRSR